VCQQIWQQDSIILVIVKYIAQQISLQISLEIHSCGKSFYEMSSSGLVWQSVDRAEYVSEMCRDFSVCVWNVSTVRWVFFVAIVLCVDRALCVLRFGASSATRSKLEVNLLVNLLPIWICYQFGSVANESEAGALSRLADVFTTQLTDQEPYQGQYREW
jgi:hypothetical protein